MDAWRLELFYKTATELRQQLAFLKRHQDVIQRLNLTNKGKGERGLLLESAGVLLAELPQLQDVCVHYAINHNYTRDPARSMPALTQLCGELAQLDRCSLLLVSGGGQKRRLETVTALQAMAAEGASPARTVPPLYVAFNPYLPTAAARDEEQHRLHDKLAAYPAALAGVYLQMGSDIAALRAGLTFLHGAPDAHEKRSPPWGTSLQPRVIYGSVFLPTRKLLAQMRFRPWSGVYLSDEYLSSVEAAEAITADILKVYASHDVIPVVESPVQTEEQLHRTLQLLQAAHREQR